MGREERTSHKQNGFKYALIASVLFVIAVLLQIYSIFQIAGGGEHVPIIIGKKRNVPCGMAVAGIIVGVLGAGIMLFLMYFPQVYQHFNPPDPMELP